MSEADAPAGRPKTQMLDDAKDLSTSLARPAKRSTPEPNAHEVAQGEVAQGEGAEKPDPMLDSVVAERYRLVAKLGEGGMGAVYRGEHVTLRKPVAVKFLHKALSEEKELVARFEREAVATASLNHPNIVAATDFGRLADGTFFIAMEFVEGRSLRGLMSDGPVAPQRAIGILRQVGAALSRAHGQGIVHRDMKPENVVLARDDDGNDLVKVIDFGIARVTSVKPGAAGAALTQMGTVFGTPEYMAPEQAMGQAVDAAADQYALGVMAYELFAGRLPFESEEVVDILLQHVNAPVPRLSAAVPGVPAAVDEAVAKMMAKSPSERFRSVSDALATLAAGASSSLTPVPALASVPGAPLASPAPGSVASVPGPTPSVPRPTPPPAGALAVGPVAITQRMAPGPALLDRFFALPTGLVVGAGIALLALSFAIRPGSRASDGGERAGTTVGSAGYAPAVAPRQSLASRLAAYQRRPDVTAPLGMLVRGDAQGAIAALSALSAQRPTDGLAAYFLGTALWMAQQRGECVRAFSNAVQFEPQLAHDPTLLGALTGSLSDPAAGPAAAALMSTAPFALSREATEAIAAESIDGLQAVGRARARELLRGRGALLAPRTRARVRLRTASSCEELNAALEELESVPDGVAASEARAVRSNQCWMLTPRSLCRCPGVVQRRGREER